jgi:hypothetical protein
MCVILHKKQHIKVGRFEGDVDEGIAPLIEELWKADIITIRSCQEHEPDIERDMIMIKFLTQDDALAFMNIVGQYTEEDGEHDEYDSLWDHIQFGEPYEGFRLQGFWGFAVQPCDDRDFDKLKEKYHHHPRTDGFCDCYPHFVFSVTILFDNRDYPEVLKRMQQFNAKEHICDCCGRVIGQADHS